LELCTPGLEGNGPSLLEKGLRWLGGSDKLQMAGNPVGRPQSGTDDDD
jgi:hypothetical protein